jgi:TrkA domain protein
MSLSVTSRGLPGIGICQELELTDGSRLGVVTRRSGKRDLLVYDAEDPDAAAARVILTENEAQIMAELLGGPQVVTQLAALHASEGLVVEQLPLEPTSPFAGRALGDTQARSRTGASIVAVLRDSVIVPSPAPDYILAAGDLIAVVGTQDAIDKLSAILDGSDASPPGHPG